MNYNTWQLPWRLQLRAIPAHLRSWLLEHGSLTKRMRQVGTVFLDLLSQEWTFPMAMETRVLGLSQRQYGLVRSIVMGCDQRPFLFARTVLPEAIFRGTGRKLRKLLDHRPIGDILFREPGVQRTGLEICLLDESSPLYQLAGAESDQKLWARRSHFVLYGSRLLITEVFFSDNIKISQEKCKDKIGAGSD